MRFLPRGLAIGSSAMVLVGSAAMAPACGSDSSCEETRSCGSSGKDGGAGSTGDSGPDAPTACEKDGDCENGLACDGEAKCVEHVCVPGTPVACINPDAAHCSAACVEPSGECEISANDVDGDNHLDALCTFATVSTLPSDDCDDAHDSAHPGATEICDGLDNDCNAKADVFDGLPLSGVSQTFVATTAYGHPSVAWSPTAEVYAVTWEDNRFVQTGDEEVFLALLGTDGQKIGSDTRVSNGADESVWPRVAWGEDSFGVVWGDARSGNFDVYFRRFDESGVAMTAEIPLTSDAASSEQADIVAIPGGWLIVLADTASSNLIHGVRINLDGVITKPKTLIGMQGTQNAVPRAALLGSDFGLLYSKLGSTTAQYRVAFLSANFDFGVSQAAVDVSNVAAPNAGGIMGDIAPNGGNDGFLFAHFNHQTAPYVRAGQLNQAGAVSCSVSVGTAATVGAAGDVVKVAGGGAFLYATDAGATAKIHLGGFSTNCLAQVSTQLDTAATLGINPNFGGMASGAKGMAIAWEDVLDDAIRIRVTGPNLCD